MASCVNRQMAANYRRIAGAGGGVRTGGREVKGENLPPSHGGAESHRSQEAGSREAGGREARGGEAREDGRTRTRTTSGAALSQTAAAKLPGLRQGHADPERSGQDAC